MKKEKILEYLAKSDYKPLNLKDLAKHFDIISADEYVNFSKLINSMEDAGEIIRTNNNLYHLPYTLGIYKGTIVSVKKNFAFAKLDDFEEEIFIPKEKLNGAIFKDLVLVKILKGKTEGSIYSILKRGIQSFVGEYQDGFVLPDDKNIQEKIYVNKTSRKGLTNGLKVVSLLQENNMGLVAYVTNILGHKDDPGIDILSVLVKHEARTEFSEEVLNELKNIPDYIFKEDYKDRKDLTNDLVVTIDGDDAKDFDDAIEVRKLKDGYKLLVHIADVSYYVKDSSFLDKEAFLRGNSIYLVNKVVPMLPFQLSNGICSLNPKVERLTLTCEMDFSESGDLLKYEIYESIIESKYRLTYNQVNKLFKGESMDFSPDLIKMLENGRNLAKILQNKRKNAGEIELDIPEAKFIVDENGKVKDIISRVQDEAEAMIEAFMISANETVANHIYWMKLPFIYRVHDQPIAKKIKNFYSIASTMGYKIHLNNEEIYPKQLQAILNSCKDDQEKSILGTFLLRSLAKAKYQVENIGHFGLASKCYTHFTSPIRRYPDLIVHRLLREYIFQQKLLFDEDAKIQLLQYISEQCSNNERKSIEIEREVDSIKKAEYMLDHQDEVFEGVVSSVISKGIFVELYNTVEGMVSFSDIYDDYYVFDEKNLSAIGTKTRNIIKIGDKIKVKVKAIDKNKGEIDFELLESRKRKGVNKNGYNKRKSKSKS